MSIGIYKIENLLNGKIYIGQSIHIETRWAEHCRISNQNKSLISTAIAEFGKENFSFQILEECEPEKLTELETQYIFMYDSFAPQGYNVAMPYGDGQGAFTKYTYEDLLNIIADIKTTTLTFKEIANKYNLDLSMIYYLNRGNYHTIPNENYPLRPVQDLRKKTWYCIDCGIEITKGALRCTRCDHQRQQKVERPSRDELKRLIYTQSFTSIGQQFGVSDNSIKKWCQSYNLPARKKDIKNFTLEEWDKI